MDQRILYGDCGWNWISDRECLWGAVKNGWIKDTHKIEDVI